MMKCDIFHVQSLLSWLQIKLNPSDTDIHEGCPKIAYTSGVINLTEDVGNKTSATKSSSNLHSNQLLYGIKLVKWKHAMS